MKAIYRKRLERLAQLLENWSVEKKLLVAPEGEPKVNKSDFVLNVEVSLDGDKIARAVQAFNREMAQ